MVDKQNIDAFVNYNYIPFSRSQCIKRLILIWIFSAAICFIGTYHAVWAISLGVINSIISGIFITLIVNYSLSKISRFMCDGIFWLYISIILNLASYRVAALQIGDNWLLLIVLLFLLLVCIFIFTYATLLKIKSNKYSDTTTNSRLGVIPILCGVCGILVARIFLQDLSQQMLVLLLAFILLLLSFMTGIASIHLLKVALIKMPNK